VRSRASQEFTARAHLAALDLPVFLPCYTRVSRWSDRRKTIQCPLFGGYLFAQVDSQEALYRARRAHGVAQVIAAAIEPGVIADLERIVANPERVTPADYRQGERVTIARGPLAGIAGIVDRAAGAMRLVITVEALGRACAVQIAAGDLEREYRRAGAAA
jgi:transcription antitermination factor NusG